MARTFAAGFGPKGERDHDLENLPLDVMDDGAESHHDPIDSNEEDDEMDLRPKMEAGGDEDEDEIDSDEEVAI